MDYFSEMPNFAKNDGHFRVAVNFALNNKLFPPLS